MAARSEGAVCMYWLYHTMAAQHYWPAIPSCPDAPAMDPPQCAAQLLQ